MKKHKNAPWFLIAIFLILTASLAIPLLQGHSPIDFGLDLAGGAAVTYRPDFTSRLDAYAGLSHEELLALCKETLKSRLYQHSNTVPDVVVRGDERIVVSLANIENDQEILELIGKTYHLTFRLVEESFDDDREDLELYPYQGRFLNLEDPRFSGDMLDERTIQVSSPGTTASLYAQVEFEFRSPYDEAFGEFTEAHLDRELAILLDDRVEWSGTIESAIRGRGTLQGTYTMEQAGEVAMLLRSGSLPIGLEVESLTSIGPSLGQELREEGWRALVLALGALVLTLAVCYQHRAWMLLTGLVSLASLFVAIFGMVALLKLPLDLVGIAGLILSIGMGMDAFILIFEALEERLGLEKSETPHAPATIAKSIYSFSREGRVLLHANATTLLVISLLFATERLKSFASFIVVGILASLLTILVTRQLLLRLTAWTPARTDLLGRLRRYDGRIFRWHKLYAVPILVALGILGVSLFRAGGLDFGQDFQPGIQLMLAAESGQAIENAADRIQELFPDIGLKLQRLGEPGSRRHLMTLGKPLGTELLGGASAPETTAPETSVSEPAAPTELTALPRLDADFLRRLLEPFDVRLEGIQSIDERVSSQRLFSSLGVLWLSFLCLGLYFVLVEEPLNRYFSPYQRTGPKVSRRWIFGGIFLAVLSDLLIVLAVLAALSIPFSLAVVAGLLTVIGYSVNDSVVLWNHVQKRWLEQRRHTRQISATEVITVAIDRLLPRTVLTSFSTLLPALAILAVDLAPLRDFAWAVLTGTIAGTLSSIFVVGSFAVRALEQSNVRSAHRDSMSEHKDTREHLSFKKQQAWLS